MSTHCPFYLHNLLAIVVDQKAGDFLIGVFHEFHLKIELPPKDFRLGPMTGSPKLEKGRKSDNSARVQNQFKCVQNRRKVIAMVLGGKTVFC